MINSIARFKRQVYRQNRDKGMSRRSAAIAAGYPHSIANRRQLPPEVVDFNALFEQKGLTNIAKVAKCLEGMNADKVTFDKLGREQVAPDWAARHKYLELSLKLCKQLDIGKQGDTTNILMIGTLAERIKKARETTITSLKVKSAHLDNGKIIVDADVAEEGEILEQTEGEEEVRDDEE